MFRFPENCREGTDSLQNRLFPWKEVHKFEELMQTYLEHFVISVSHRKSFELS